MKFWMPSPDECACCGSRAVRVVFDVPDRLFKGQKKYPIGQCKQCGSLFLLAGVNWSAEEAYPKQWSVYTNAEHLHWYHRILPTYFFPRVPRRIQGRVVDMGCGTGLFVEFLKCRGHDVLGVEMSDEAVHVAKSLGRPVIQGNWESYSPPPKSIAVLVLNHVIEHITSPPAQVFAKANEMLQNGGLWVIRTPNASSWGRQYFGEYWHPLEVPRHVVVYNEEAIKQLAKSHGFMVTHTVFCGRAYDLLQSTNYSRGGGRSCFLERIFGGPFGSPVARFGAILLNLSRQGDAMEIWLQKAG